MISGDPLANLRDIHVPDPTAWWPPAPGWWLLVLLGVFLLGLIVYAVRDYRFRSRPARLALRRLMALEAAFRNSPDPAGFVQQASLLMKQFVLGMSGDYRRVAQSGEPWLRDLDQFHDCRSFSNGPGRVLAEGPYKLNPDCNPQALADLLRDCFKHNKSFVQWFRVRVLRRS